MNKESNTFHSLSEAIIMALRYFDYFKYPLTKVQLSDFLGINIDINQSFDQTLQNLIVDLQIQEKSCYYALKDIDNLINNRIEGEQRFKALSARIEKSTHRLRRFPFVKFIGLSGSLSKGYASENADIDLFIVTQKNRLWICRTILHLFKKISFVKGSQHWYCMNYFVDETALEIEEQNYFTAIELATLKPLADKDNFHQMLLQRNAHWMNCVLPNYSFEPVGDKKSIKVFWAMSVFEFFGNDFLNTLLMKWTDKKWRLKWAKKNYPAEDYELAFKTRINVSKNHLHNYQKKVLDHLK